MKSVLMTGLVVVGTLAAPTANRQVAAGLVSSCESLASLKLPLTTITGAHGVASGAFRAPGAPTDDPAIATHNTLPAFCRVEGLIQPSRDSHIEFEVWMPSSGWNGKYLAVGNGGFAGSLNFAAMSAAVTNGYATSSTDTGHKGTATYADWALGHPEKVIDYGYRAIHEMTDASKGVVRAFYGAGTTRSYFSSCSNGGRQAFMEAQRYPSDYDGIIAGAPSYASSRGAAANIWNSQAMLVDPTSYVPASKLPAIQGAALAACDAPDGVKDGVIDDPTTCRFNPEVLLCRGAESDMCLTQPQVSALKKIYAGPRNSKGEQIAPGFMPGAETGPRGWALWVTGSEPGKSSQYAFGVGALANMVFDNSAWDYRTFNFDRDVAIVDAKFGPIRNATNPDLTAFKQHGGKLIVYHGWNDPAVAPLNSVNYYRNVASTMGQKSADDVMRLYMVPGMQHCGDGPGTSDFGAGPKAGADAHHSLLIALEGWVEKGVAPAAIIATKYNTNGNPASGVARTRPLCPYPQVARYTGSGSTDDAANFVCRTP